jgi:REP-associated tyrosine transposase
MSNQVHLTIEVDSQFNVRPLVKALEGSSSRRIHQECLRLRHRQSSLWTNSYVAATTGGAPRAAIKQHIENQKHV